MFLKCLLLLFVVGEISAQFQPTSVARACPYPRFEHGRVRLRQKSKLIKFICFTGYQLAGNKYATCRDGEWDVPIPVCVKPGCTLPSIDNGLPIVTHGGAWVVVFCYPHHQLLGSQTIYCDGRKWNGTLPQCVDTTAPPRLSCNFEDATLCGWSQDELHDFDWKRLNRKTPSSFLFTGPSYDHTFGAEGNGYYMYIESTSRLENDTARLISPVFDSELAKNGCFSFYYHMYGKTTGGLRIYQKPEKLPLPTLLSLPEPERRKYLLFDKWGNQGDVWYNGVAMLADLNDDFQIVIEGIRGTSFTSDIAIDDVTILQGNNCSVALQAATSLPAVMPDSCQARCDVFNMRPNELGCGCTAVCVAEGNCCPDFFDLCLFDSSTTPEENPPELPQTQKLVAHTTPKAVSVTPATIITTPSTTTTTTTLKPTTIKTTKPTTIKPLTPVKVTTKIIPKIVLKTTPKVVNKTGEIMKDININKPTKAEVSTTPKLTAATTRKLTTLKIATTAENKRRYIQDTMKAEKEQKIEAQKVFHVKRADKPKSSGFKTVSLTITGLLCLVGAAWLFAWSRSTKGRTTIARLRGRVRNDPDVRYLHAAEDDCE